MNIKPISLLIILLSYFPPLAAQLRIASASSEVNFREGPGLNFKIMQTVNHSNLLVILPREAQNGFLEAFDVETSSRGFVYESLIQITDTLYFGKQNFFEKSGENEPGEIEIALINKTSKPLYVWINKISYDLSPHEKKFLIMEEEEIIYFASTPGLFPVFGREWLKKGNTYVWNFAL
ncbi:MAG: hypothetical protein U0W24_09550 [Bacteroidales bacterium]